MNTAWRSVMVVSVAALLLSVAACADKRATLPQAATPSLEKAATISPQTTCPVMGGAINKDLYVDYDGKRIYACCAGCIGAIKKDPAKYVRQLEAKGITLDTAK